MGRTKRKRKKKKIDNVSRDTQNIINLQKSIRLKCPKLKIHYFDDTGWGVKCKINIQKNDTLIALPLRHLITPEVQCDIFNTLNCENLSPQFILSLFLIYEVHLGNKSKHFNYINSLPKAYTNLYFCTEEEVKLLPSFLREELCQQEVEIKKWFKVLLDMINGRICDHCGKKLENLFVREKFEWAWFTVNTRSVYYQDEKNVNSMALAPFLDMFNHSNDAQTQMTIDFDNNLYILKTLVKYKKFDQVFIKYGGHSNLKLLVDYGFILPNNENDFVEFTFEEIIQSAKNINPQYGELTKFKQEFIRSNKLDQILSKSKEFFSWNFEALLYVLVSSDEDEFQLQSKIYSDVVTNKESVEIEKIKKEVVCRKLNELQGNLRVMENLKLCTECFQSAKNLIEIYVNFLS